MHKKHSTGAILFCLLFLASPFPVRADAVPPSAAAPYVWRNVVIGGGGFVTGIITHPIQKDLMYARTDVGGAYRWDNPAKRWIPLLDWLGPTDNDFMGIESIAVDPSDSNRVYLAAGTYSRGRAAILRSTDQGRTFERTEVPFKMGGNELGRFNGERLAVDPHQGEILFFGSRRDGLWKSADRAVTWRKVESFPAIGQSTPAASGVSTNNRPRFGGFGQQSVGIVRVLFDPASGQPGSPTPVIYAAMSVTETNFLRSADAGATWQSVANQPSGLRPNHVVRAADGMLYLSYGREAGPNSMDDGAVWKFNPKDGTWLDITPVKPANSGQPFGYGSVAVDAQHPSTLVVTTFCHWKPHDEVFRSTNGGANWTALLANAEWDFASAPYAKNRTPHWMGDIEINPFNSDQIFFTTGFGLFRCDNANAADAGQPTHWEFLDQGLEETVPLTLLSPGDGAHLLSGVGDVDGFRHDDLDVSPTLGTFPGPRYGNTEDLACAALNPAIIVRCGTGGDRGVVHAAISEDGGKNWNALASEPPASAGAGTIAISADGKIIVWTPRRSVPHFSLDRGKTWTFCAGLSSGIAVTADPVNVARFFAFDAAAGKIFVSTNGATNFTASAAEFPRVEGPGGRFGGGGVRLCATPGVEGDLWLAFRANGLFHTTDSGNTCVKLAGVDQADSFGLGKAAPGTASPTLFLAGRIHQLAALFRSDDAGATWQRINDDQHQYGYFSHVTGDSRIFGRVYFATGGRGVIYGDPK